MALNDAEIAIVKGMLARGDRQHDIAAYFGINGGRIAEISTLPAVIAKLRADIRALLPDLKERFEKSGGEVWDLPDDKVDAFVASEYEIWTKLIREAGIKLD